MDYNSGGQRRGNKDHFSMVVTDNMTEPERVRPID